MKILHIAVHLGGGVGTVLRNWIKRDNNEHTILLLNRNYYGEKQNNIYENLRYEYEIIKNYIKKSDIVIIHFWNHPILFEFLLNFNFPLCRVCIWSHVSALYPPYVHTEKLVQFSDKFILSSLISNIEDIDEQLCYKIDNIWTTGGIDSYLNLPRRISSEDFIVGFIGTLDFSKIHPEFINICHQISLNIPNVKFVICGEGKNENTLKDQVYDLNMKESFNFTGRVDILDYLPTFNIFGYPLTNTHFGTCEQVLGEVLACGIQPVVLNNLAETYILKDVGLISNNIEEYISNIIYLSKYKISDLQIQALKNRAIELYDIDKMINKWNDVFNELLFIPKTERRWNSLSGFDIFVESIGKYGEIIKRNNPNELRDLFNSNSQWKSECKGGVLQYIETFPNDDKLKGLAKYL